MSSFCSIRDPNADLTCTTVFRPKSMKLASQSSFQRSSHPIFVNFLRLINVHRPFCSAIQYLTPPSPSILSTHPSNMKASTTLKRASAQLTRAIPTAAAHPSRLLSSVITSSEHEHEGEQYTATDAANFSLLGASITALPPDEHYTPPFFSDNPSPTGGAEERGLRSDHVRSGTFTSLKNNTSKNSGR